MDSPVGRGPNKQVARSCQGVSGNTVILCGSGLSGLITNWHPWHDITCLSASLSMAGHHTLLLSFCLVPTMPKCPSWARFKALARSDGGNTMRVPLKTNCPITLNSLASGAYSLHSSKPPVCMACLTLLSSLSAADASSTVLVVSALRVAFTFMLVCLLPLFPTDKTRKRVCYVLLATVVVLAPISRCECMVLTAGHRQFPAVFDPWLIKLLSVYVWMESLACPY